MGRFRVPALAAAFVCLSACYALGVFGGGEARPADARVYTADGFIYSGELRSGYFDGNGVIGFDNGDSYAGGFADGRIAGKGVFIADGGQGGSWRLDCVFAGESVSEGTFYFADGEAVTYGRSGSDETFTGTDWGFSGAYNADSNRGTGAFTLKDGSVYTGGFLRGMADGEGIYTDPSGKVIYAGGFENGAFHGRGSFYGSGGWIYEGGLRDGLFDGEGAVTDGNGTVRGVWERGIQTERHE